MIDKEEFSPILKPGIHPMNLDQIQNQFVVAFKDNARRKEIFARFCSLLDIIRKTNLYFEVWIDGSFLTLKDAPDDIDASFMTVGMIVDKTIIPDQNAFDYIFLDREATKIRFLTDAIFVDGRDINQQIYWKGLWGFSRKSEPKGFVRLEGLPWATLIS